MTEIAVVILNWNGAEDTKKCIKGVKNQSLNPDIIVVDNNSNDGLVEFIAKNEKNITVIQNSSNLGFSGGVNTGIRYAMEKGCKYVALINNDAIPKKDWLRELVNSFDQHTGIVTSKIIQPSNKIDSEGDQYSVWGIPWPRNRGSENNSDHTEGYVFAASGGASIYRVSMLKEIGLFDEDFFAYYEDVDLSFRAQLNGWKIKYNPKAVVIHKLSTSSNKVPGLTAYMMLKNMPWLFWKNVPTGLMPKMLPRFVITYLVTLLAYVAKGRIIIAFKALVVSSFYMPKKLLQRYSIQKSIVVDSRYIDSLLLQDLPPNARVLRKVRSTLGVKV